MKKLYLRNWLFIGAMSSALFACQSKKTASTPEAPCAKDDCPAPSEVPCREGECDEREAGEEAMIHVIEIAEPVEEADAASAGSPFAPECIPGEGPSAALEPDSSDQASTSNKTKELSEEVAQSKAINLEAPCPSEGPATHPFETLPSRPVSENTVVLTLEQ